MKQGEEIVREWANFHPDVPLTPRYADLARRINEIATRAAVAGPRSVVNLQAWTSIDAWLRENPTATAAECLAELVRRIEIETAATSSPTPAESESIGDAVAKVREMAEAWLGESRIASDDSRSNAFYERCNAARMIAKELESLASVKSLLRDPVQVRVLPTPIVTRDGIPCEDQAAALEEFKERCRAVTADQGERPLTPSQAAMMEREADMARDAVPAPAERTRAEGKQDVKNAIIDGAIGCRNCGDTWERNVSANGIVAPCEDCGDGSYNLAAPATPPSELQKLRQAVGWICDAADAAYIEDSDNQRIHEIFNIAAQAAGLTRRLPDEHGRFDETSID